MNTQVAIDALREIEHELPVAIQAGDRKTVDWIQQMVEEVEYVARRIRKEAEAGLKSMLQPQETNEAERARNR